jgi:hypothetical protein
MAHAPIGAAAKPRLHGCCIERSVCSTVNEREMMSVECDAADAPRMTPDSEPNMSAMAHMQSTNACAIERLRSIGLQI